MGNTTTSQHASNIEQHSILGEVTLTQIKDSDGNIYDQMTITKIIESQAEFNRWYKQLSKIDDTMSRQVLLLPNKTVYESTGLCGSSGVVRLSYDHYPYVFQVEIDNRRKINRFFLETQLWYLLYNMVRAGSKFEKYHTKIGDVHPNNILINNDGLVKLVSTCSFPRQQTNFYKIIQNPHRKVFLAPQQLEQHSIQRAEYPKNIDPSLSQCYSIGLCMLAAGTLQDIDSIYSSEQGEKKIQRHKVNYYLKLFGQRYSSFLHSMIMGLLADNPLQRKKCSEIYSTLFQYQDKILDLQSFLPTNNNSRLSPYPQQNASNIQIHPVNHHRQMYEQHPVQNRVSSPQIYYHPNGVVVNPIQSKYIPINSIHNQPVQGFRHSISYPPPQEIRGFRPNHFSPYGQRLN